MLTMTDLFCGAGGSSSGAVQVPGVEVAIAANHWDLAIATHNTNHPKTDHDCADISQVDPRRYPRTDILWASPECTNHSQARGKRRQAAGVDLFGDGLPDEAAERSRATMWDVPRFAEHHHYRAIIVENVVDAANWVMWPAWIHAMDCLGYEHRLVWLNSMHAQAGGLPAPQSRDRMYVVLWRRGQKTPDVTRWTQPLAWCSSCDRQVRAVQSFKTAKQWGRYRAQYVYRCPREECRHQIVEPGWLPAAVAIDWTLPAQRIGDRTKPLAPKTMARIAAGLARHAIEAPTPFLTVHRGGPTEIRTADLVHPAPTMTASGNHLGLLVPVEGRDGKQAQTIAEPMRTMTTRNETGLVVPLIIPLRQNNSAKPVTDPLDTIAAAGNHHAMVMRNNEGGAEMSTPITEVLRTLTTAGHQSLIQWDDLVLDYNGPAKTVSDPLPTQTTVEGDAFLRRAVDVEDCLFRMLAPREIAAGMAFAADYVILGNKREQVRQAGNAVTPPAARDLIAAVAESLSSGG